jgi:hypothetical protein
VLIAIIALFYQLRNSQQQTPAPMPTPQVTVIMPTDEILDEIRRLQEEQAPEREESKQHPTGR